MDMDNLNDLILGVGDFCLDPTMSFEEMEDIISDDNNDSKEIEGISFGHMEPIPKFDDLEDCLMQDGESIKENETEVQ